jgi:hypothetical protein
LIRGRAALSRCSTLTLTRARHTVGRRKAVDYQEKAAKLDGGKKPDIGPSPSFLIKPSKCVSGGLTLRDDAQERSDDDIHSCRLLTDGRIGEPVSESRLDVAREKNKRYTAIGQRLGDAIRVLIT